ncbi:MAG: sterol desaturase family protein [gamma proteobacterium symbiont of Phacoides pectinatus]
MNEYILTNEPAIRIGFSLGVFVLVALWELASPKRPLSTSKAGRWLANIGIVALNTLLLRLLFPAAAVGIALFAQNHGWGLFNAIDAPLWLALPASVVLLDFAIWLQHVMVHAIPLLWRLHRVHHADLDYDVTTGARFHPIEIILSMLIKSCVILLLGPPLAAVVLFEILLNATAMFNHGNIHLPEALDRVLRLFVVTPDMHRVHHSVEDDETNSNFGFNLPWWDRLFGTYRAQPRAGHMEMRIGIRGYRDPAQVDRIPGMLWLPFRGRISAYTINRRNWDANKDT